MKITIGLFSFTTVLLLHVPVAAETVAPSNRGKAMDAIVQKFESLSLLSSQERLDQTIQFAGSMKEVRYATATSSGDVGCVFNDGVPYVLQVPKLQDSVFGTSFNIASEVRTDRLVARKSEIDFTSLLPTFANPDATEPELPTSNRAILVAEVGARRKSFANLERLLSSHGYAADSIASPTVSQFARLGQAGIVYLDVNAFPAPSIGALGIDEVPMFATCDTWSAESEHKIYAQVKPGQIGWLETYNPDPKLGRQRVAMVSQRFLEETWDCAATRLVVLVGPNSLAIADQLASGKLGRSTFCAFVSQASDGVPSAAKSFLARALGTRDPNESSDPNESPDRPFAVNEIADDIGRQYLWASLGGGVSAFAKGMPYVSSYGASVIQLAPSVKHAVPQGNSRLVDIEGAFGADPGAAKRSVTLKSATATVTVTTVTVKKWTPTKITIELPDDVNKAQGELTVVNAGRRSNSRWLSSWTGEIKISITGEGSLNLKADFNFTLIGDPWTYREKPGAQPNAPMVFPFVNVIGTTCTWIASGEKRNDDGTVQIKWVGGGSPAIWVDVPNALLVSRQGTFSVGAVGDSYQKLINLNPGMLENMDFTEGGYTEHVPVKLGDFNQGQTIIQPHFDSSLNIAAQTEIISDEPDKVSYGALNGKMESFAMACNSPMPPNAPR